MNRTTRIFAVAFALSCAAASGSAEGGGLFPDGRWEGSVDLRPIDAAPAGEAPNPEPTAAPESLALRLFPADPETGAAAGGLVDLPSRGLYGFPLGDIVRDSGGISFSLRGDAPFDGLFELKGAPQPGGAEGSIEVAGRLRLLSAEGEGGRRVLAEGGFSLAFAKASSRGTAPGVDCPIDTGRGVLPGSLVLPDDAPSEALPIVLFLSGAQADRDGNNYAVPGRSDSLALLAAALGQVGVASLRFDKRGTGEAYALGGAEGEPRLDAHIEDARAALRLITADPRFSSVTVVGLAEGALVGACALEGLAAGGLVALCASGKTEAETVEEALSSAPPDLRGEAEAIMAALKAGEGYPNPSPYFADFFRPSVQPYLSSLFARDIRVAFAAAEVGAALVVAGGSDLQVVPAEAELLASARVDAAYRVVPGMSHALKGVGGDEEANYASFTDPGLPLAEGLVDLLADFAKRSAKPGPASTGGAASMRSSTPSGGAPSLAPGAPPQGGEDGDEGLAR
jgi:uncharacterized protein